MTDQTEILEPEPTTAVELREAKARAQRQEDDLIDLTRTNALRAAEIEQELLEKAKAATGRELPGALRAVADVRAKSVDNLLKLTNRVPGEGNGPSTAELLQGMVSAGFLKVHVELGPGEE